MIEYAQETLMTIGAILAAIVLFFVVDILKEVKKIRHIPELIAKVSRLVDKVDYLLERYAVYEEKIKILEKRLDKLEEKIHH
jgi:uncharacterized protein (DUF4213/DUF364 family)